MLSRLSRILLVVVAYAGTALHGSAQDASDNASTSAGNSEAATTDDEASSPMAESPAIEGTYESGFDLPYKKSLLNFGFNVSQGLQVSPSYTTSPSYEAFSVTRLYGILQLNRKNRRYQTNIDYKGGALFHTNTESARLKNSYVQQFTIGEQVSWQRTSLILEDAFNVFPGGNFGQQAFGGVGGVTGSGPSVGGGSNFYGFNYFGGLGQGVNINNVTLATLTHEVTPRSSFSLSGGLAVSNYIGNAAFIGYRQATGTLGYYYSLSPRTNLSLIYGYQYWDYPQLQYQTGSSSSSTNTVQLGLQHELSARLSVGLSGGGQFINTTSHTLIDLGPVTVGKTTNSNALDSTAYAYASYGLKRSTLSASYSHLMTSGSGYFAGSENDIVQFTLSRQIGQHWAATTNAGFVRLSSIQSGATGVVGSSYKYTFAGVTATRQIGKHYHFSAVYQFNDEIFGNPCSTGTVCASGQTHTALFEFSWRKAPVRID